MAMATIRPRSMKVPFDIHHDEMDEDESLEEEEQAMEESRPEDEEDMEEDAYSELSEDSDGTVDASVVEDMERFQETFKGIKDRFRLINRIGEGELKSLLLYCLKLTREQVPFPPCTKLKT